MISVSSDMWAQVVQEVIEGLEERGHTVTYYGPKEDSNEVDWPVVSAHAAEDVVRGDASEAIVFCWTGTGASIAANKLKGIRAALCCDAQTARGARKWNHANVLALSIRTTTPGLAREILDAWFDEPWSSDEWNLRQIERIKGLENDSK